MNDENLIAGLDERAANERLAAWLNERLKICLTCVPRQIIEGQGARQNWWDWFTESHDSIHRVLDAMNDRELAAVNGELLIMFGWESMDTPPVRLQIALLRATPAQKAAAALWALKLGVEAK